MARRAWPRRSQLNERTPLSWAQTKESLPATDSSSPVIAVMQPAHALLTNHCTVFPRACPASRRLLVLGSLEKGTPYRPTGYRCALASIRVQTVLGHALQSAESSGRWPQDLPADPRIDLSNGR